MHNLRTLPLYARLGLATVSIAALTSAVLFTTVRAQTSASAPRTPRILAPIDNAQLATLRGNVNPHANAQNDRGPVSASLPMTDMLLVLSRSPEQQAAFDAYVAGEYDSSSPDFHKWLTPAEIGQRFGPAESDIAALTHWLASQGFAVKSVAPDRMSITFSGAAGQVQAAFHTQIHNLMVKGVPHIANMTDPQIPSALAPVVVGVKGLHNFLPHPLHKMGSVVQLNSQTGRWQRVETISSTSSTNAPVGAKSESSHPQFTINDPNNGLIEDVTPYDFATIYNLLPLWSNSIDGTGQTIAIAGTSDVNDSDVSAFRTFFGISGGPALIQLKGVNGLDPGVCTATSLPASGYGCTTGDLLENSSDVEWSGATAKGAQIVLVTSGAKSASDDTVYDSISYVLNNLTAHILSVSYGLCELGEGTSGNVAYYDLLEQAASEGIAAFVATGDSGSPSCDENGDVVNNSGVGGNPYSAQFGLSVSGLASTPFATAVGGTDFNWCNPTINSKGNEVGCSTPAPYWNSTNLSQLSSAANYIPETPWNDTCENPVWAAYLESIATFESVSGVSNADAACNFVEEDWSNLYDNGQSGASYLGFYVDTIGGSGGTSNCVVNSTTSTTTGTCTTDSTSTGSIPLHNDGWQKPTWQTGVTGIPSDGVRDIPDVSFFAGDGVLHSAYVVCIASFTSNNTCAYTATSEPLGLEVGGTSLATPAMAGVMALIDQKAGLPQGLANPSLYKLGGMQTPSQCSAETVKNNSSCYFQDVDQGTNSMPCNLGAANAEGGLTYANGNTELVTSYTGLTSPNCAKLNSGDEIGTLVQSDNKTPAYSANTGYDLATGLGSLNVANVVNSVNTSAAAWLLPGTNTASLSVTLNPTGPNVSADNPLAVSVSVSGGKGMPTGSVSVTGGGYTAGSGLDSSGKASITIPAGGLAAGSVTLTIAYSGDGNYASASTTESVTVTGSSSTYALTAGTVTPSSVSPGSSATDTISGAKGNGSYTGTVTLSVCKLTNSSVSNPNAPPACTVSGTITYSAGTPSGSATANVSTTAPTTGALTYPNLRNGTGPAGKGWLGMGGGAVLAFLIFLGVPARRRSWRAMLGLVVLIAALGSLSACGGGGGGGGGGGNPIPGTSAGTYTFTVSGSSSPSVSPAPTTTFTVTVN